MSRTLELVRQLAQRRDVRVSEHGYDELSGDDILIRDVVEGVADAILVEDYVTVVAFG